MILRKPYAFLVKHFRLIHTILTLIIAFLVYRTNILFSFLTEYIRSNQTSPVNNITNTIFDIWMFVLPFVIIILSLVIISLMSVKKKPIFLYIFNIGVAIAILVLYNLSYTLLTEMEAVLLETRRVRLFRDFITILELFQGASLIFVSIRATGFDLKKFNFSQDLEELNIEESDNEEFEVNLELDTNEIRRKFNRFLRMVKYFYLEHRFMIKMGILILIGATSFTIYMNIGIYERTVKQNTIFSTTSFSLGVTNSYITNQDYKGNKLDEENMFVILELNLKSKRSEQQLDVSTINLQVGGKNFYHTYTYKDAFIDLGNTYQNSMLQPSFEKQLLVFQIPKTLENEKMVFMYTDKIDYISNGINSKYIKVEIKPQKLDTKIEEKETILGHELILEDSPMKKTKLNIQSVEMKKEFRETYSFCITESECYPSAEFIHPNYNSNDEKAILKLTGTLEIDPDVVLNRVYSLYHFIYYFSTLKYEKDGKTYTQKVTMNQIKPTKFKNENTYYIEIAADVLNASKVWFDFHIRNHEYRYQILSTKEINS